MNDKEKKPIFIHSGWRTGSTFIWQKFREIPEIMAFYEPFNEQLQSNKVLTLSSDSWASGHGLIEDSRYFAEFFNIVENAKYTSDFALKNYFINDEPLTNKKEYIDSIIAEAVNQNKQPVLCFCRSLGKAAWFKKNFDASNILLVRNPIQQFASGHLQNIEKDNPYFDIVNFMIIGQAINSPMCEKIASSIGFPQILNGRWEDVYQWYKELSCSVDVEKIFSAFLSLYIISHSAALPHMDLTIDIDLVSNNVEHRKYIENKVNELITLPVDLSDARVGVNDLTKINVNYNRILRDVAGLTGLNYSKNIPLSLPQDGILKYTESINAILIQNKIVSAITDAYEIQNDKLHERAAQADELARQADERTQQTINILQSVYASRSWRITLPLRWTGTKLRKAKNWRQLVKRFLFSAYEMTGQTPRLRGGAEKVIEKVYPSMHNRLQKSWQENKQTQRVYQSKIVVSRKNKKFLSKRLTEPAKTNQTRLFMDISELAQRDANSGIQRVVKKFIENTIFKDVDERRVEIVYAMENLPLSHANNWTAKFFNLNVKFNDLPIDPPRSGDIYFMPDYYLIGENHKKIIQQVQARNGGAYFVVYDLLPVLHPDWFMPSVKPMFVEMLERMFRFADGIICISRSVADELFCYLNTSQPERKKPLNIGYFHLGSDFNTRLPKQTLLPDEQKHLEIIRQRSTFLMVGTVEPRKGHAQAVAAFEILWNKGIAVNLFIVGKQGWLTEDLVKRIRYIQSREPRLIWPDNVSDSFLLSLYRESTALLMASQGEGFGLPLIEAAHHGLPIITKNIPVFREVAGEHAFYFNGESPDSLAEAIREWLRLHETNAIPSSQDMPILNWEQSIQQALDVFLGDNWYKTWSPSQSHI